MRVLVTGGAGFIGSHLVDDLVRSGHSVRVLDNFTHGTRVNLTSVLDDVEMMRGDIRSSLAVGRAATGCEVVFHQAALNSVGRSFEIADRTMQTNATGTLTLLRAAAKRDVRRVVFASSSSVYGAHPAAQRSEDRPTVPLSPYAASKLIGEGMCRTVSAETGLETVALRYFNVFGPRQLAIRRHPAAIPAFIECAVEGRAVTVFGRGYQRRDFTFVSDVVAANRLAANAPGVAGSCLNVGTGRATQINHLVQLVGDAFGRQLEIQYAAPRPADVENSFADISAAQTLLRYDPKVSLTDGLRRTVTPGLPVAVSER